MFFRNLPDRGGSHVMVGYDDRGRALYVSIRPTATEGRWRVVTAWESREAREILKQQE